MARRGAQQNRNFRNQRNTRYSRYIQPESPSNQDDVRDEMDRLRLELLAQDRLLTGLVANFKKQLSDNFEIIFKRVLEDAGNQIKDINDEALKTHHAIIRMNNTLASSSNKLLAIDTVRKKIRQGEYKLHEKIEARLQNQLRLLREQSEEVRTRDRLERGLEGVSGTVSSYLTNSRFSRSLFGRAFKASGGVQRFQQHASGEELISQFNRRKAASAYKLGKQGKGAIGLRSTLSGLGGVAKGLYKGLGPTGLVYVGLQLIVGSVKQLFKLQSEWEEKIISTSKSMGVTLDQAEMMNRYARQIDGGLSKWAIGLEDIESSQKALAAQFGNFFRYTGESVKDVALLSKNMGVAEGNAAGVLKTMTELGATTEKANLISVFTAKLAEAGKVAPDAVMRDIAESSETAAKFFSDAPGLLAKAAVEAKRLGLSLKDMEGVSSTILDIESSLKSEMEARVMLGRNINFDRARQLVIDGKILDASEEILNEVGGIVKWNKMDFMQKEAIAKATGLTASQLQTSLKNQQELSALSNEQRREYDKITSLIEQGGEAEAKGILQRQNERLDAIRFQKEWAATIRQLQEELLPIAKHVVKFLSWFVKPIVSDKERMGLNQYDDSQNVYGMNDGAVRGGVMVRSPKGTIQLNKNDSMIAGTNLFGKDNSNDVLIKKIEQLIQKVDQPVYIKIGNRVIDEISANQSMKKQMTFGVDKKY